MTVTLPSSVVEQAKSLYEITENVNDINTLLIPRAALAAPTEPEVWFCPDCGTISDTQTRCCPDWIRSRKVTKNFAETCKATFARAIAEPAEQKLPEFFAQLEYNAPDWDVIVSVYQRFEDKLPKLIHQEKLPEQKQAPAEPVAWIKFLIGAECKTDGRTYDIVFCHADGYTPLYAAPQPQRVALDHGVSREVYNRVFDDREKLLRAIRNLRSAAYWIVEGGEFYTWVENKMMPLAAAKELDELREMEQAARAAIAQCEGTQE